MDIKIGEYVRNRDGILGKILEEDDIGENGVCIDTAYLDDYADETNFVKYEDIKNHSFDIIDLIEVGDYVNGHLVVDLDKNIYNQKLVITEVDGKDGAIRHHYLEKSIKSIVTKEQFEAMEYEV